MTLHNSSAMQPGADAFNRPAAKPDPFIPESAQHVQVRLETVKAMLGGISTSALYADMAKGVFPRPITISRRMVVWPLDEVERISAARISGKSPEEIRVLVSQLVEARKDRS